MRNNSIISFFPNLLSLIRILMTPFIISAIVHDSMLNAFCLMVFASFTDFLDGYTARFFKVVSGTGRMLDSLADKILTLSVIWVLYLSGKELLLTFILFISMREIFILGLRFRSSALSDAESSRSAKWKTFLLLVLLNLILLERYLSPAHPEWNFGFMCLIWLLESIVFLLSLLSMIQYVGMALNNKKP